MSEVHRQIVRQARGRCFYCDLKLKPGEYTIDHVIPISLGGDSSRGNMVLACSPCNSNKGSTPPAPDLIARAAGRKFKPSAPPRLQSRVYITETDLGWTVYDLAGRVLVSRPTARECRQWVGHRRMTVIRLGDDPPAGRQSPGRPCPADRDTRP